MFSTEFKGEKDVDHHVLTVRRPSIPAAEERIEEIEIPGRNGGLTSSSGLYDNIVIPVEFNFMSGSPEAESLNFRTMPECFIRRYFAGSQIQSVQAVDLGI